MYDDEARQVCLCYGNNKNDENDEEFVYIVDKFVFDQ